MTRANSRSFFQQIVADPHRREQVLLVQGGELLRPLEEKVELRGQRAVAGIAVEALQERILGGLLEDGLRFEARAKTTRESRLCRPRSDPRPQ